MRLSNVSMIAAQFDETIQRHFPLAEHADGDLPNAVKSDKPILIVALRSLPKRSAIAQGE